MKMNDRPDWHTDAFPELRAGPPWVMQEMIEAEPALVERIAAASGPGGDPAALALLCRGDGPLAVVGCGTSEHGALGVAEMLREAGIAAISRQAFEASCEPQVGGAVIAVSHEGGTWATVRALRAARVNGSATGLITARPESESAALSRSGACSVVAGRFVRWHQRGRLRCYKVGSSAPEDAELATPIGFCSGKWHAARWPSPLNGTSGGSVSAQISWASGQRVRNRQPDGG